MKSVFTGLFLMMGIIGAMTWMYQSEKKESVNFQTASLRAQMEQYKKDTNTSSQTTKPVVGSRAYQQQIVEQTQRSKTQPTSSSPSFAGQQQEAQIIPSKASPQQAQVKTNETCTGMTMLVQESFSNGTVRIGCDGACNTQSGDTSLNEALPLLCRSYQNTTTTHITLAKTQDVPGKAIKSLDWADALCAQIHGAGRGFASILEEGGDEIIGKANLEVGESFWVYASDSQANPRNQTACK